MSSVMARMVYASNSNVAGKCLIFAHIWMHLLLMSAGNSLVERFCYPGFVLENDFHILRRASLGGFSDLDSDR